MEIWQFRVVSLLSTISDEEKMKENSWTDAGLQEMRSYSPKEIPENKNGMHSNEAIVGGARLVTKFFIVVQLLRNTRCIPKLSILKWKIPR